MALTIRLRQQGKTNRLSYRLVLIEEKAAREGRYVENLGWYDPHAPSEETTLKFEAERIAHWLALGASISEHATSLVKKVAPQVIKDHNAREVARRAKALAKRKERKARQAAA